MFNIFTVLLHWKGTWLFKYYYFNIVKSLTNVSFAFKMSEGKIDSQLDCDSILIIMIYIMKCVRWDIAYVINELSRFMSDTNRTHRIKINWVSGYLRNTQNYVLYYKNIKKYSKDLVMQIGSPDKWSKIHKLICISSW